MTDAEIKALVGRTVSVPVPRDRVNYEAAIIEAKSSYGHVRVKIRPLCGDGDAWKNLDALAVIG